MSTQENVTREAFLIRLKEGALQEWIDVHDEVWPELLKVQGQCGVKSMTVYALDDRNLLVHSEIVRDGAWEDLIETDIHKKWVEASKSLNDSALDDNTVGRQLVREVLHLDFDTEAAPHP